MQPYERIITWQRAHQLLLGVYRATRGFPSDERFGLTAQLRRAVFSVPTNIAEGARRKSARDYARFLDIAAGSLSETEYLLRASVDLEYLASGTGRTLRKECNEIAAMLHVLRQRVEAAASRAA